jgi:hypothetical protein
MGKFKTRLKRPLEFAQQAGALGARTNPPALPHQLVSSMQGVCVTAKGGVSREELLDRVEVTLSAFR